jgi:hypothetical protein
VVFCEISWYLDKTGFVENERSKRNLLHGRWRAQRWLIFVQFMAFFKISNNETEGGGGVVFRIRI